MKKALVLALTAFMVLSLATAAFAVEVTTRVKLVYGGEMGGAEEVPRAIKSDVYQDARSESSDRFY